MESAEIDTLCKNSLIIINSLIYEKFTKLSPQSLDTIIVCFS